MAKVTIEYDSEVDAKTLINVLKENQESDRIKYSITIIKKQESPGTVRTPTGERIKLSADETQAYNKLSTVKRRKYVYEQVFFKASGTFKGSKPDPKSPFQTAGPFYSNSILGQQIFPGYYTPKQLHDMLSRSLNDHDDNGRLGDWRLTHSKKYGGFWSYRLEKFVRVSLIKGEPARNIIIQSDYQESR